MHLLSTSRGKKKNLGEILNLVRKFEIILRCYLKLLAKNISKSYIRMSARWPNGKSFCIRIHGFRVQFPEEMEVIPDNNWKLVVVRNPF